MRDGGSRKACRGSRRPVVRSAAASTTPVARTGGYAPLRAYAAIGDGRTVALVARDGAIDWLCLPDLDSPAAFAALLDAQHGGRATLEPEVAYESVRRYVAATNVLETTFETAEGTVVVTDAMTLPTHGLAPYRELVRRVECVRGRVPMRWSVAPRFAYGARPPSFSLRAGVPVAASGCDAVAVVTDGAGAVVVGGGAVGGRFVGEPGGSAVIALAVAHQEPLVLPPRAELDRRLDATVGAWSDWASSLRYDGRWRDAVVRSALALKLLVFAPSGAIAAAPTTSLPETIGGERNWDYRFSWPRDAAFALRALLGLGVEPEARAFFSWLLHATQLTHPQIRVLYRLNGRTGAAETTLPLDGYVGSKPVRVGNAAAGQTQLDVYGEVVDAVAHFARSTASLDRDHAKRVADIADFVCEVWREPDAGIWETRGDAAHFTQSKMMCAVALDRACELAEAGLVDGHAGRWRAERDRIREFVESNCYSEERRSYTRSAGESSLDASLILGVIARYDDPSAPRLRSTVDAVRRELATGPLLHRYVAPDGLPGEDGAFVACSFWLAEAYARQGRVDEAVTLMDELVPLANDVGLFGEEIDPRSTAFLGNFPQALSHLALITAAVAIAEAEA